MPEKCRVCGDQPEGEREEKVGDKSQGGLLTGNHLNHRKRAENPEQGRRNDG